MVAHSIGGEPVLRLTAPAGDRALPRFVSAQIAPGRAMMLLQVTAEIPGLGEIDVMASPPLDEAVRRLNGGLDDAFGNAAFAFGGAILAPFANRIRGRFVAAEQAIETEVLGKTVRLPANGGGKAPGAEPYAIHGLILDRPVDNVTVKDDGQVASTTGVLHAGDFNGRWPGDLDLTITWTLDAQTLSLKIQAHNQGPSATPIGLGWHPYFALPSGDRRQARVTLPAASRIPVDNYDAVLPTGEIALVADTPYDFSTGAALGDLYLDDCFTDLDRNVAGEVVVEITDPAAGYGVRVISSSPQVQAIQTYAPPGEAFVVVEPQFNLANPFGAEWQGLDTGMVVLGAGEDVAYDVRVEIFHG